MRWVLARLREPSTIRGLVWLATVAGLSLRPDQVEAIVAMGMALAGLLGVFLGDGQADPVERVSVGGTGDRAASGADRVRDDLPELELVGKSLGNTQRNTAPDTGCDHQRAVSARAADRMRSPVPVSSQSPAQSYQSTDPNTYPRFGAGFGDRD